ncbi:transcriptional regulator [Leptospira borgpetersenii]|uniref:transcriptional regulator n=1 Tax=Leptospira borgpetersenii TaxID=174 RepID=UPI001880E518|nr:transcriptional regulator [Leptospira borgpetersenii]MBE8362706.1 transcriptional regulator [Leptospira borgpetersenii serovar Balcanica]MBE8369149.1 transcriptional regulator [Leptospira borgpetersenii serovar Balcanica]MBE8421761.1 transcriptional regulator [Leptospira borgpetersenii serovar Balcanica]MBF3348831.1 transcriptional regulator [Leptospira borgpetersenii serovar Balcanica]
MENKDLQEEFEELMSLFLFGETELKENKRLNEIIALHPEFEKRYDNYVKMQMGLKQHKLVLEQILSESSKPSPKIRLLQRSFRNQFIAIAAAISLIVSLSVIFKMGMFHKTEMIPMEVTGACNLKTLRHNWIRIDQNSFCEVKIHGEQGLVHFRIFPNSEVRILKLAETVQEAATSGYGLSIFLQKGNLLLNETLTNTASQTKIYLNGTAIQLNGTKVWIESAENRYKVNVWDGSVRIRSGIKYLLPFLLDPQKEELIEHSLNKQTGSNFGQKTELEKVWADTSSEDISNSYFEIKPLNLSGSREKSLFKTLKEDRLDAKSAQENLNILKEIQQQIIKNVSQKKQAPLNELYLKDLENISNQLGNSEPIKLSEIEKKQEPIERKTSTTTNTESNQEKPLRLGNKTIQLKDGTILKGNVIQYGSQYILEENGKKRIIESTNIESISF